jgi:hypothetical protein
LIYQVKESDLLKVPRNLPPTPFPAAVRLAAIVWIVSGVYVPAYLSLMVLVYRADPGPRSLYGDLAGCLFCLLTPVSLLFLCVGIHILCGRARNSWERGIVSFLFGCPLLPLALLLYLLGGTWECATATLFGVSWVIAGIAALLANNSYRTWRKEN